MPGRLWCAEYTGFEAVLPIAGRGTPAASRHCPSRFRVRPLESTPVNGHSSQMIEFLDNIGKSHANPRRILPDSSGRFLHTQWGQINPRRTRARSEGVLDRYGEPITVQ